MISDWDATAAAERGAAWLDAHDPGWALAPKEDNGIDTQVLDMSHCELCVLGQRFAWMVTNPPAFAKAGGFERTWYGYHFAIEFSEDIFGERIDDTGRDPGDIWLGFNLPSHYSDGDEHNGEKLTKAWIIEIDKRRKEAGIL